MLRGTGNSGLKTASCSLLHSEGQRLLHSLQGEGGKSSLEPRHLAQGICVLLAGHNGANLTFEGKMGRREQQMPAGGQVAGLLGCSLPSAGAGAAPGPYKRQRGSLPSFLGTGSADGGGECGGCGGACSAGPRWARGPAEKYGDSPALPRLGAESLLLVLS